MAVDKLVDSTQLDADLTSVANAIRTKGGTSASLAFPSGFVSAINEISGGGGAIGGLSKYDSGTFTVASDYNYTTGADATYTGSVLVTTTLADIKIIAIWDEAWAAQTATRGCFGAAVFVSGTLGVPGFAAAVASPYHYGSGFGVNASTSNWFTTSSTSGPILHEMTTSVDAGKFGLKTNSSTYPLRAGDTIHWIAWGT